MSFFQLSRSSSETRAYPYPGRSTKRVFSPTSKKLMSCVQPGRELVNASCACVTSRLRRLDLPTLLRPRKATSISPSWLGAGKCAGSAALDRNLGPVAFVTVAVAAIAFTIVLADGHSMRTVLRQSAHTTSASGYLPLCLPTPPQWRQEPKAELLFPVLKRSSGPRPSR